MPFAIFVKANDVSSLRRTFLLNTVIQRLLHGLHSSSKAWPNVLAKMGKHVNYYLYY